MDNEIMMHERAHTEMLAAMTPGDLFERILRLSVADGTASERTIRSYRDGLAIFLTRCRQLELDPIKASFDDIQAYRRWLVEKGYKRSTIRLRLMSVRVLYRAMVRWGRRQDNPADGLRAPRMKDQGTAAILRKALSPAEVGQLEAVLPVPVSPLDRRDRAFIYLTLFHGLRVSEISSLDIGSVDASLTWMNVMGKGDKRRHIILSPEARRELRLWLGIETNQDPTRPLFYRFDRPGMERLGVRSLQRIVDKYFRLGGLKHRGRGIHALRHTHAVLACLGGAQREIIADEMGHERLSTTDLYTRAAAAWQENPANAVARALNRAKAQAKASQEAPSIPEAAPALLG